MGHLTSFDINRIATQLVQDYTGLTVKEVKVAVDPVIRYTYAIRATFLTGRGDEAVDFLIEDTPLERATDDDLIEVTYASWPPPFRTGV